MLSRLARLDVREKLFLAFAVLSLLLLWAGIGLGIYWLGLTPILLFGLYITVTDYRWLFYGLILMIPLSTEVYFGSLGTDLPTEPLMIGLSVIFILHFLRYGSTYDRRYFTHPLALLLYAHLGWIFLTTLTSEGFLVSLKFSLAKCWYIGAFFLMAERFVRSVKDIDRIFTLIFWPLLFVAVQSLIRHAMIDFDFQDQFKTIAPFMRNHVSYAGILAVMTPWLVHLYGRKFGNSKLSGSKLVAIGLGLLWLVAIYFSYTRAATVSLILAGGAYLVIRYGLLRPVLAVALVGVIGFSYSLVTDNSYLEYAPNYETTVAHKQFDELLAATTQLEDVSTMERVYRWVAAGHMIPYHPWLGWGPGNFVEFYKGYTVSSFVTYVSDNPERSGIHSYYLMTLVEQGFPGLAILLVFFFGILIYGEKLYASLTDPAARSAVMAAILSMIVIFAFQLINDMIETDKMGSIFFLNLAVIVSLSFRVPGDRN
ncbi:O-antigen polymerase [Lewinellaceae bacterium SD302]|nr:O-antigen polymerase [Lewinellaceae bacterium SD302]